MTATPGPQDYPPDWTAALAEVAWQFTQAVTEAASCQAGDGWDLRTEDPATELAELRRRLDDVAGVVDHGRQVLDDIETAAQRNAAARGAR